jgi:hypothetical protein
MATAVKRWSFAADTEGWTPQGVDGPPPASMAWYKLHQERLNSPQWLVRGGCLKVVAYPGEATTGYWQWQGAWTALGVPAGMWVKAVTAAYLCRWQCIRICSKGDGSPYYSAADAVRSGPLALGGTEERELIAGSYAAARSAEDPWRAYPVGPLGGLDLWGRPNGPPWVQTDPPQGWLVAQGDRVTLAAPQAAATALTLRLHYRLPSIQNIWDWTLRLKQDEVVLTVEYGLLGGIDLELETRASGLSLRTRPVTLTLPADV